MARFSNNPFPNVTEADYANYQQWPAVTLPDGQVVYEVPGNSGYVLDPVASNATGRKVFRANPKGAISKQNEAEQTQKKLIEQQTFNGSPLGQLVPVAGSVAGLGAAAYLAQPGPSLVDQALASQIASQTAAQAPTLGQAAIQGAGATQAVTPAASSVAGLVGPPVPASLGQAAVTEASPSLLGGFGSLGIGPQAGIIAGTALTAKGLYDLAKGKKGDPLSRGVTAMSTFGFSEGARALGLGQPSTRDIAKKHTKELLNASDDPNYKNYVSSMREQYNAPPPDPSKPFAGKYRTFDEYKTAGLEANDLSGVYGNLKTFGPEWSNLSQDQRVRVTSALINHGLYDSKKGEVVITDPEKAKQIKNELLGAGLTPNGTVPGGAPSQPQSLGQVAAQAQKQPLQIINPVPPGFERKGAGFVRRQL